MILENALPDDLDGVMLELTVGTNYHRLFGLRLSDQDSTERIMVMQRQSAQCQNVTRLDRQECELVIDKHLPK